MIDHLFSTLYPVTGLISLSAYVPQIAALVKATGPSKDVSVGSWLSWIVATVVALGYGIFSLRDLMFCLMMGMSLVMMVAVLGLVLYNRYVRFAVREEKIEMAGAGI